METVFKNVHRRIQLKSTDTINLWLWGDVHYDLDSCDRDRFKWFLQRAAKDDPELTYYMGLGDYHDFASTKEQATLKKTNLHKQTIERFDMQVQRENRQFANMIKQMRGKLLGLIHGNHGWSFLDGTNSTDDLASRMGTDALGWLCHYTIAFDFPDRNSSAVIYIVACHGKAGGKTHGITINQVADLKTIFPIADIYVMGHDHQRAAHPCSVIIPSYNTADSTMLKQKRQFLCRSGSFKKAYQEGQDCYEVGALYKPSDLGALKLRISFHRDRNKSHDRFITDIEAII